MKLYKFAKQIRSKIDNKLNPNEMKASNLKTCNVTGIKTAASNFYGNQRHVKAVDNLRRLTGANRKQLTRMFNQLNTY